MAVVRNKLFIFVQILRARAIVEARAAKIETMGSEEDFGGEDIDVAQKANAHAAGLRELSPDSRQKRASLFQKTKFPSVADVKSYDKKMKGYKSALERSLEVLDQETVVASY